MTTQENQSTEKKSIIIEAMQKARDNSVPIESTPEYVKEVETIEEVNSWIDKGYKLFKERKGKFILQKRLTHFKKSSLFTESSSRQYKRKEEEKKEKDKEAYTLTTTLSKSELEEIENTPNTTLSKCHQVCGKWLQLRKEDYEVIDVFLATCLDRKIPGEPLWLFIVAPSGTFKTELIRSTKGLPNLYTLSSLTSKTLVSGKVIKPENGDEEIQVLGLAKELDGKVLLIKDFTVILDLPSMERGEIFSQLRDIYDGYTEKAFGNFPEPIRINCKMGLIAGVTPAIDKYQKILVVLGERFLKIRSSTVDRDGVKKASQNSGHEEEMRKEIGVAVKSFLMHAKPSIMKLTDEQENTIVDCATYVSLMRTHVYVKYNYKGEIIEIEPTEPESPTRIVKQLTKMANLLAVVRSHEKIEDVDIKTVKRIAQDTAIPKRQKIVEALLKLGCSTAKAKIAGESGLNFKTVQQELEKMESLSMITLYSDKDGGTCCFTKDFQKLVEVQNTCLSSPSSPTPEKPKTCHDDNFG
jgi:hypothetical protein